MLHVLESEVFIQGWGEGGGLGPLFLNFLDPPLRGDYQDYLETWQAGMKQAYGIASIGIPRNHQPEVKRITTKRLLFRSCDPVIVYSLETCQKEKDLGSFVHTGN